MPGAYDMGFAKMMADTIGLYDLKPAAGMIQDNLCGEIGCAANDDQSKLVIYLPFSWPVNLNIDLTGYQVYAVDLETRWVLNPIFYLKNHVTSFRQLRYNHDYLIIACKE